jgi:hypothetical protein
MADSGVLYILTNPAMRGLVKIGFTTKPVKKRLEELTRASGVPLPFECYFAAEVPSMSEKEKLLHKLFATNRANPKREFFRVDPERVILAIKMGPYVEVTPSKPALDPEEEKALAKAKNDEHKRLADFTFDSVGVPVGALLRFTRDQSVEATVAPNDQVKYDGQVISISKAAKLALKKVGKDWKNVQGPMYWMYNGKTLHELHEKLRG